MYILLVDKMHNQTKFIISALGIFFSYFYFGILQEELERGRYGDNVNKDGSYGDRFTYALTFVGIQCLFNWIFAKVLSTVKPEKVDKTHCGYYICLAITCFLSMVSSNMTLRWVPYPTQVIGKSAKPIPVMILGVLIGHKRYTIQRYCFVITIVVGIVLFMMKEGKVSSSFASEQSFGIGEVLLILSLSMDGLTGAIQDRMRAAHSPTANHMMLAMNAWSTCFVTVLTIVSGELFEFIAFANRYPQVLFQLALLAITGAVGQMFIFVMVSSFGPLACSVVTTTRKFFTVLFSVIFFGNVLTSRQWFGAFLVFLGLFADAAFGKGPPKKIDKSKQTEKLHSIHSQ